MQNPIHKHLRFNIAVGLLDGGFFGLGMGFGSFTAIVPLFVHHLTESALLIGLVPAIHNMGWQLPQLFTASRLAGARRYKPITLWMTIHERLPFLGLSAVALAMPQVSRSSILLLTFCMLVWQGFGAGLAANPWTNLVSKVIPSELHGVFFGAQAAAFNGFAGVSALVAGYILDRIAIPSSFALCFALTFACMVVSFVFLSATREDDSDHDGAQYSTPIAQKSLAVLRENANFRGFLAARVLSHFAAMGFAFYVIYAVRQYALGDPGAAALVAILLIGEVVLSPLMGRLGDRWSHRGVMIIGAIAATLSALLAWRSASATWFYAIFLLEAFAIVAIWTIPLALSVQFASNETERPLYIGMANTIPAPAAILAPVIGGLIADRAGYGSMFALSAASGVVMALVLLFLVRDPPRTIATGTDDPAGHGRSA